MTPQLNHLCQQANSIANAFAMGYLPQNTAWVGFTTMLWPSLCYSLPVTSFSELQSLQITWKLYCSLLPKLGMVHSFPLPLWHAPSSLYSLALPSILWEQGITALHLLLDCGNWPSVAGSLLHTSIEQVQLEVGSLTPFYQLPFQQYGFLLTNCWLKSVWSFLSSAQLCLQLSSSSGLHLQWEHGIYLMDHLISTAAFIPAALQSFNHCQLYMHCLPAPSLLYQISPSLPAFSFGLLSTPLQPIGPPGSPCSSKSSAALADTCSPLWATGSTHPIAPAPSCTMTP